MITEEKQYKDKDGIPSAQMTAKRKIHYPK
jgi:hypothetical protein